MDDRLRYGAIIESPDEHDWRYLVLGTDPEAPGWCHLLTVGAPAEHAWRVGRIDGAGTDWVCGTTLIEPGP